MSKQKLSVIIPCYNEAKNIERGALSEVNGYLKKVNYPWEVLICDDGSTDNSRQLVSKIIKDFPGFKLLELEHGGKPSAIFGGIKQSTGNILLFSDMDQSTPIGEVEKLLPWFSQGFDVIIGSRGLKRQGFPWWRKIASVAFRMLRGIFLLPKITDTQCGFKAIKTDLAKQIFPRLSFFQKSKSAKGWSVSAYDAEMLFIADKWGYKIKEVPVQWQDEDTSTTKKRNSKFLKQSIQMGKEVVNVLVNDFQGNFDRT